MRLRSSFRRLQTRLAISLVGVALITALCLAAVGELATTRMTDEIVRDQAETVLDGTQRRIEDRQRAKEVFAQLIATNQELIDAVAAEDSQAAATILVPLRTRLGLSEVTLFTLDGETLLALSPSSGAPDKTLLNSARAGLLDSRATATASGLLIEAVAPMKNASGIVGAVVVGVTLVNTSLATLVGDDERGLAVIAGDRVAAATVNLPTEFERNHGAHGADGQKLNSVEIDGQPFVELDLEIDGGALVVLIPTNRIEQAQNNRRTALTLGAVIVAFASAVFGLLQARRMTKPIKAIGNVATRIGRGDYEQVVELSGIAEVDDLGAAINTLATAVQQQMTDLSHQSLHDPLTGLANRTLFADRCAHALRRRGREIVVLFIDLDNFKEVNDTLGHEVGDELLSEVAGRLNRIIRDGDTAARLGGDEFGILVEDRQTDPTIVAERFREALAIVYHIPDRDPITITCSIGIGTGLAGVATADSVLRDADTAMYVAKNNGKNRFVTFETDMHLHLIERAALKADLATAHTNGELFLHYQPIVSLPDLEQHGAEALVRWTHPDKGPIGPDTFIPLAEETGLIVPLGRWILHQACLDAASWQHPNQPIGLSVNVSARQFHDESLLTDVSNAIATSGLPPHLLTIEITETSLMKNLTTAAQTVRDLKILGVRVSLDDFGTGYSSLNHLQQFDVDEIKIDKSFVSRLDGPNVNRCLIQSVIHMANAIGAQTVAEGIETVEQLQAVTEMGCTMGQGYYLARPGPTPADYTEPVQPTTTSRTFVSPHLA